MNKPLHTPNWLRLIVGGGSLTLLVSSAAVAQSEPDSRAGYYTQEEWYDPTDWFDGDNYDWEPYYDETWDDYEWNDTWDYGYDYTYDYDDDLADDTTEYSYDPANDTWTNTYGYYGYTPTYTPYAYSYMITYEPLDEDSGDQANRNRQDRNQSQDRARNQSDRRSGDQANQRSNRDSRDRARDGTDTNRSRAQDRDRQMESIELRGTVQAFRHTELEEQNGERNTYTLAKVKLDGGDTIVMSLGEKDRLERLDLRKGDDVVINGSSGRLGGQKVIIAQRVQANGENVRVNGRVARVDGSMRKDREANRMEQRRGDYNQQNADRRGDRGNQVASQRGQQRMDRDWQRMHRNRDNQDVNRDRSERTAGNRRMTLVGTVEDFHSANVPGAREPQSFVRIELENGRSATVLLGTEKSVKDLDLEDGDYVYIRGTRDTIGGRTVLRAESIRVEGERVELSSF
jgi:hypothetical protein